MTLMDTDSSNNSIITPSNTSENIKVEETDEKCKEKLVSRSQRLAEICPNLMETSFTKTEIGAECQKDSGKWSSPIWQEREECTKAQDYSNFRQCSRCCQLILEQYYFGVGNNQFWHKDCLRCEQCHLALDSHRTCFVKNGQVFCKQDYNKLFGKMSSKICFRCQTQLESSELVMRARKALFHVSCFTCCECSKSLKPGDEVVFRKSGKLFCLNHWIVTEKKIPSNQNLRGFQELNDNLTEEFESISSKQTKDKSSHQKSPCSTFYCDKIKGSEGQSELTTLLPAKKIHSPNSLKNDSSGSMMTFTSPEIDDYEPKTESLTLLQATVVGNESSVLAEPTQKMDSSFYLQLNPAKKSKTKKKKKKLSTDDTQSQFSETESTDDLVLSDNDSLTGTDGMDAEGNLGHTKASSSSSQRQKRVRTSFKHHQLRTMKSYFSVNHNPDAKDLKQLSQKTGLSKRVLQVWFQNARAKFRRSLQKQQEINTGGSDNVNLGSNTGSGSVMVDPSNQNGLQGMVPGSNRRMDCNLYTTTGVHHDEQESPSLSEISSAPPSLTEFGSPNNLTALQDGLHYHFVNNPILYPGHVLPPHSSYLSHLGGPNQGLSAGPLNMNLISQVPTDPSHHTGMLPPHPDVQSQNPNSASFFSNISHGINCLG